MIETYRNRDMDRDMKDRDRDREKGKRQGQDDKNRDSIFKDREIGRDGSSNRNSNNGTSS